jgi:hypothetical protein
MLSRYQSSVVLASEWYVAVAARLAESGSLLGVT